MEILKRSMKALGIAYSQDLIDKFEIYMELLLEWNKKVNITTITNKNEFQLKHFADSLLASCFEGFRVANNIIDIGTGGGFPGLPLALCFPEKNFTLSDSLNKRIKILNEIVGRLGLANVQLIHARAEDMGMDPGQREKYDVCLSRAVAKMPVLLEYCLPFVKKSGYFGAYKAGDTGREIAEASRALNILGGIYYDKTTFAVINEDLNHEIIWFKKLKNTPSQYPRKAGTPSKQPL